MSNRSAIGADTYPATNLVTFVQHWKPVPENVGLACRLDPEWVGTAKHVSLQNSRLLYSEERVDHIRFSHLAVWKNKYTNPNTNFVIFRGRINANGKLGSYRGSEAPRYSEQFPASEIIKQAKTVEELESLLGPQTGFSDCCPATAGWTLFTLSGSNQLRYLNVFVQSASQGLENQIDSMGVSEGFFRPANPNSIEERTQFKTGEEVNAEWEAARAKARQRYPLPLRSLVEARETPDDSDLRVYHQALNEVRRNPSPKLFEQFAEWIHEGTREISSMLETLLFSGSVEPWTPSNRIAAIRALVDALPKVTSQLDLEDLLADVLNLQGGGKFKLLVPGTDAIVDIESDGASGRSSFRSSSQRVENLILKHVAKECAKALRERYPELR